MKKSQLVPILLAFTLFQAHLAAESYKFKDGRLDGEPVVELQLSKSQIYKINNRFKPGMQIKLTPTQRKFLSSQKQLKGSITQLQIWKQENLKNDCTCFLWNVGILFRPDMIEIPIHVMCSDKDAVDNRAVAD
jgi:hypothetical protein